MLNKIILGFLFWKVSRMDPAKSILFELVKIKNMELRNQFVRSATYDYSKQRSLLNLFESSTYKRT